ncbi:MAG: hypothetical protein QUT30_15025, partial [Acidobacteriota bacterium]|nr:hypothetical protein [Acidobacteriota bacterium]
SPVCSPQSKPRASIPSKLCDMNSGPFIPDSEVARDREGSGCKALKAPRASKAPALKARSSVAQGGRAERSEALEPWGVERHGWKP